MNTLNATIKSIQTVDNLNIVAFTSHEQTLKMMSLDLTENIQVDTLVNLHFKPTTVSIAKNITGELSIGNQLAVKILSLEIGELLSVLHLGFYDYTLESIITTSSLKRMDLKVGDNVTALIKSSDLSIKEVL
jgi:molybdopterin-binding protein